MGATMSNMTTLPKNDSIYPLETRKSQKKHITFFVLSLLTFSSLSAHVVHSEPNMKPQFREYIQKGYIELGMTAEEVRKSWGEPKIIKRTKKKKYDEIWIYAPNWKYRNKLFFNNGILVQTDPDYLVVSKMEGHGIKP